MNCGSLKSEVLIYATNLHTLAVTITEVMLKKRHGALYFPLNIAGPSIFLQQTVCRRGSYAQHY